MILTRKDPYETNTYNSVCRSMIGCGIWTAADRNSADQNSQDPVTARKEVVRDVKTTSDSRHNQNHAKHRLRQGGSLHETMNVAPDLKVGDWGKA